VVERRERKDKKDRKDGKRTPRRSAHGAAAAAARAGRVNRYAIPKGTVIDYKNLPVIQRYITDRGKIVSRRISGINAKQQRDMSEAIRRARFLGLLTVGVRKRLTKG